VEKFFSITNIDSTWREINRVKEISTKNSLKDIYSQSRISFRARGG